MKLLHFSILLLIFTCYSTTELIEKKKLNLASCYSMRLHDVPTPLKIENGKNDSYISFHSHDRLIIQFQKACGHNIICKLYNDLQNTYKTLMFNEYSLDYYMEEDSHGHLKCSSLLGEILSFHVLVRRENGKFFTEISLVDGETEFMVYCPGGFYSKDVKLKINGNYTNYEYDPLRGFKLSKHYTEKSKFYQCEKFGESKDIRGLIYDKKHPVSIQRKTNECFKMKTLSFIYRTEIQCVIENPWRKNVTTMLSCPAPSNCPNLTMKVSENLGPSLVFSGFINNTNLALVPDYYCVFLSNDMVIAHARLEKPADQTALLVGIVIIIVIVVISLLINICEQFKKPNLLIRFDEKQLLLSEMEQIGKGHSATVHVVQIQDCCLKIVVKCSRKITHFSSELNILKALRHPNIIAVLGTVKIPAKSACFNIKRQHLVLPYYPEKSLNEFINQFSPHKFRIDGEYPVFSSNHGDNLEISLFNIVSIGMQVGMALEYLKTEGITHRDVALRNVLISDGRICKLADFERAQHGETQKMNFANAFQKRLRKIRNLRKLIKVKEIPVDIYPIEALDGYYFYASEVFSYGNLLLTLFNFGEAKPYISWDHYTLSLQKVPDPPQKCPTEIYNMIVKCMQFDYKLRPEIGQCVNVMKNVAIGMSTDKYITTLNDLDEEAQEDMVARVKEDMRNKNSGYDESPYDNLIPRSFD